MLYARNSSNENIAVMANIDRSGSASDEVSSNESASNPISYSLATSRVTLVEDDSDLGDGQNCKHDGIVRNITSCPSKFTWVDHLLGVFCINVSKGKADNDSTEQGALGTSEIDPLTWPSPWILPVYVYPRAQIEGNSPVPKVAKCTIDTGNMQGNIVSREFVEDVLGYSSEHFQDLTEYEKRGGTGITGELHVPQGALYLTWYHSNSTRVFRNMRFLVSPYQGCDLIIGARSIEKDKILTIPCLPTTIKADAKTKSGELHGRIWKIDDYIKGTLQDAIDFAEEAERDTKGFETDKANLRAIYNSFSEIWNILFDSADKNLDQTAKQKAADGPFKNVLGHPVGQQITQKLELDKIEEELKAELGYAVNNVPVYADGAHDLRHRIPAKGSSSSGK